MSLTKAVTIWCDAKWCFKWENYNEAKAKDTRLSARTDGWVSTKHGDFCCLEHSKGKRTKAEKLQTKYEKRQAKKLPAIRETPEADLHTYGETMPDVDPTGALNPGGSGTTSGITSLVTRVEGNSLVTRVEDMPISPDSPVNH